MSIFLRWFCRNVKCNKIFVLETKIVVFYDNEIGRGPREFTMYYLAVRRKEQFLELFSGRIILEKQLEIKFNEPYYTHYYSLDKFLKDPKQKKIDIRVLFDFINNMNIKNSIKEDGLKFYNLDAE